MKVSWRAFTRWYDSRVAFAGRVASPAASRHKYDFSQVATRPFASVRHDDMARRSLELTQGGWTTRFLLTLLALSWCAACSSTPSAPTPAPPPPPPVADAPEVTCPAPVTVSALKSVGAAVTYADPEIRKGQGSVSVACTPPSGTMFPVGVTQAECVATDSLSRTASCSFSVTVAAPPGLRRTRIMAFGDSLTFGSTLIGNNPYDFVYPVWNRVSSGAGAIAVGTLHRSNHHGVQPRRDWRECVEGAAAFCRRLRGRHTRRGRVAGGLQRFQSGPGRGHHLRCRQRRPRDQSNWPPRPAGAAHASSSAR